MNEVMEALRLDPVSIERAKAALPDEEGFYAWWIRPGVLPDVPMTAHPDGVWRLFYVGIAPGRAGSQATLKSRVVGQHIGGNTGSSTFRLSLASLLFEEMGWRPLRQKKKVVLSSVDNEALSAWQAENAGLCWTEVKQPWSGGIEVQVIEEMEPPLNLAENNSHPFHSTLSDARGRFRAAAL